MKRSFTFWLIALVLSAQAITVTSYSQILEVDGGIGYGGVDVEAWTGLSEDGITFPLSDWSHVSGYVSVTALFPVSNSIYLGASAGFHHLFWYEYDYYDIDGNYRSSYDYNVDAGRFLALARFNFDKNFLELGIGQFVIKDVVESYSTPAVFVSAGHRFKLTENLSLPLKLSSSILFDEVIVAINFGAGLSYKIK